MSDLYVFQAMPAGDGPTSNLAPDDRAPGAAITYQPGVVLMNTDGSASVEGPKGLNTAEWQSSEAGILSTARTKTGAPVTGGVKGDDIVTLPNGMTLTVENAERLGMIRSDGQGRYAEAEGGFEAASQELEQDQPIDDAEGFDDPEAEAALFDLAQRVSPSLQVGAVSNVIETGEVDATTLNRAASEAGIEPSEMQSRVDATLSSFRSQALASVERLGGTDPMDVFDWAKEHRANTLKEAMQQHGMQRSTKGYESLYRDYLGSMDAHDPESVLEAEFGGGITARRAGRQVLLTIPGKGEVPYGVAIKAGLINVTDKGRRR